MESMDRLSVGGCPAPFDLSRDYIAQSELYGLEGRPMPGASGASSSVKGLGGATEYEDTDRHHGAQWLVLKFDQPVTAPQVRCC